VYFDRAAAGLGKFRCVYPFFSRRAGGFCIGVNLNHGGVCNFQCVYCSVDREALPSHPPADLPALHGELLDLLELSRSRLWRIPPFHKAPRARRALKAFLLSGEGEPTLSSAFAGACRVLREVRDALPAPAPRIILLTNGSLLDRPEVKVGLAALSAERDEVWVKLDAGSPEYFEELSRSRLPFPDLLSRIAAAGRRRPLVLQSMFINYHGENISTLGFNDYCGWVRWLLDQGCRISRVQFMTITRAPALRNVAVVPRLFLEHLADKFRAQVPGVDCEVFV
jgi:wyosine [tRNA(Phe)-imidazoG37] synthetase (radical SAM superfamily)